MSETRVLGRPTQFVILGLAFGLVLAGGFAVYFHPPRTPTSVAANTGTGEIVVYRNLTIGLDSSGDFVFNQLNLAVPQGAKVVFTITNFDTSIAELPLLADAQVSGTLGNTAVVSGGGASSTITALPVGSVGHTFSLSNAYYHLNVPIPAALSVAAKVTFEATFTQPGTFTWGCVVLCGTMVPEGMFGSLTVVPS